jgi:hypothetical protein
MRDLAKLRALGPDERRLLARCLVLIPWVVLGLRLFGLRRTKSMLERGLSAAGSALRPDPGEAEARARTVARVAGIAAGRGPVRATCLRRSLLIWWLLRREGIEAEIRIGVRRDGEELSAHAWVEHRGIPLGEPGDLDARYERFDRDFGAAVEARR